MNKLAAIVTSHAGKLSDKWSSYLLAYDELLQTHRARPVRLLEIGVQNGGSLEIWAKYFPDAALVLGCDINPACAGLRFDDPRIKVVVADAGSSEGLREITACATEFDIIIDDGSHTSHDIVRAFLQYFPMLADGGLYIAEDLHCSYWQKFGGGLHDPLSSMAFFKLLADTVNHEHWGNGNAPHRLLSNFSESYGVDIGDEALAGIHSIEFRNSLCIVSKRPAAENTLGPRVISGQDGAITADIRRLDETMMPRSDQSENKWAMRSLAAQFSDLASEAEALRDRVRTLAGELKSGQAALQRGDAERVQLSGRVATLEQELQRYRAHAGKSRDVMLFGRRFRLDFAIGGEPVYPREFARYIPLADAAKIIVRATGQAIRRRLRIMAGKPAFDPGEMEAAAPGLADRSAAGT